MNPGTLYRYCRRPSKVSDRDGWDLGEVVMEERVVTVD